MSCLVPIDMLFELEKGELQSTKCTPGKYNFITAGENWKTHSSYKHDCEALVFAAAASGSLGRTHHVKGKFIASDLCFILTPKDQDKYPLNLEFYHFVFNSLRSIIVAATKAGTSKESINQKNFKRYELPYFDITQQALWIDKLKNTLDQKKLLDFELSTQRGLLKQLRQQIIQEAIEGKLTVDWRKNNPHTNSANELLKKVTLLKNNSVKAENRLPIITKTEQPFALENNWTWCRLQDICYGFQYGTSTKSLEAGKIPVLRMGNIQQGKIVWDDLVYTNSQDELAKLKLKSGDLLFNRTNSRELVGKTAIFESDKEAIYAGYLVKFTPFKGISPEYCNLVMNSSLHQKWCTEVRVDAIGQSNINATKLKSFRFPLPPQEEQIVITKKAKEVLDICDLLEESIIQNERNANLLLQAVLKDAFTNTEDRFQATGNVIELKSAKELGFYKRTLLAAEIVDQLHSEPTFGHLKLQKIIFLCQKTLNMQLPTNFLQQAAGPYDPEMARSLDEQLKYKQWYDYNKTANLKYQPLKNAGSHKDDFQKIFRNDLNAIKHLIGLFKTKKSSEIEAVATLYACWEEILNSGISFSKSILIDRFFAWSEEKRKFSERQVNEVIAWMEKYGIFPKQVQNSILPT